MLLMEIPDNLMQRIVDDSDFFDRLITCAHKMHETGTETTFNTYAVIEPGRFVGYQIGESRVSEFIDSCEYSHPIDPDADDFDEVPYGSCILMPVHYHPCGAIAPSTEDLQIPLELCLNEEVIYPRVIGIAALWNGSKHGPIRLSFVKNQFGHAKDYRRFLTRYEKMIDQGKDEEELFYTLNCSGLYESHNVIIRSSGERFVGKNGLPEIRDVLESLIHQEMEFFNR